MHKANVAVNGVIDRRKGSLCFSQCLTPKTVALKGDNSNTAKPHPVFVLNARIVSQISAQIAVSANIWVTSGSVFIAVIRLWLSFPLQKDGVLINNLNGVTSSIL